MNKALYVILSGLVFGPSGYFLGKYLTKKKLENKMNEEISHIRDIYSNPKSQTPLKMEEKKPEQPQVIPVNPNDRILVTPGITKDGERLEEEKKFVDYQKFGELKKPYDTVDKDNVKKEVSSTKKGKKKANSNVKLLSEDEFSESDNPCTTIMYYQKDNILTDVDNNPIDNPINIIGNLDLVVEFANVSGVLLYTRNDEFNVDYEIELVSDKSWYDIASPSQKAVYLNVNHDENPNED